MSRDEYLAFTKDWMAASLNHLIDGGLLASYIDWRGIDVILETGRGLNLDLINMIVWGKTEAGMGSLWRSRHELLPVFCKGDGPHINNIELGKWGRQRFEPLAVSGASTTGSEARRLLDRHPTPKPCRLASDLLMDVTNRGDIVLDCFMGAGTTMIAAESTGGFVVASNSMRSMPTSSSSAGNRPPAAKPAFWRRAKPMLTSLHAGKPKGLAHE